MFDVKIYLFLQLPYSLEILRFYCFVGGCIYVNLLQVIVHSESTRANNIVKDILYAYSGRGHQCVCFSIL